MTTPNTVAVQYVGRRESFRDHLYGTGLTFSQGQARALPPEIARKFLRHADQFAKAHVDAAEQAQATEPATDSDPDGTIAALDIAAKDKDEANSLETQRQDLIDTITHMPKAALIEFARNNYRQELDKAQKLDALRDQVRGFVDQFGLIG